MVRVAAAVLALVLPLAAAGASARVLRTTTQVDALAADGATALVATAWASGSCERALAWNPIRPALRGFGPRACPESSTGRAILEVAVAGSRVAWVDDVGGNQREASLHTARVSGPRAARRLALARRDADSQDGHYVGNVYGDGSLLVYNTWSVCETGELPLLACPLGVLPRTIFGEVLWRIDRAGAKHRLASSPQELAALDVAAGRVLLQRAAGTLELRDARGSLIRALPFQPGEVLQAALGRTDIAVLARTVPAGIRVYDAATGVLQRTLAAPSPIAAPPRCRYPIGASPAACRLPLARLRFQGVDGRLLVYVLGTTVRVVRLTDGREQRFGAPRRDPVFAQLEPAGLFYSYGMSTRLKGRVQFVPRREIPLG